MPSNLLKGITGTYTLNTQDCSADNRLPFLTLCAGSKSPILNVAFLNVAFLPMRIKGAVETDITVLNTTELQAILPILREMGEEKGHVRQEALVTRLTLVAAAPWKSTPPRYMIVHMEASMHASFWSSSCIFIDYTMQA